MKTPEAKKKNTAINKLRRLKKELKIHPKLINNKKMMDRLRYWEKFL